MCVKAVAWAADVPRCVLETFCRGTGTITLPTVMWLMDLPGLELRPREGAAKASR
jgi:hypothetical protein